MTDLRALDSVRAALGQRSVQDAEVHFAQLLQAAEGFLRAVEATNYIRWHSPTSWPYGFEGVVEQMVQGTAQGLTRMREAAKEKP